MVIGIQSIYIQVIVDAVSSLCPRDSARTKTGPRPSSTTSTNTSTGSSTVLNCRISHSNHMRKANILLARTSSRSIISSRTSKIYI
jgi:hypothetical protein